MKRAFSCLLDSGQPIILAGGMPRRLNVLISAYACEPNKGSEPEVGWQWALQMARFHDVTVLTRANNRLAIERELALIRDRQPVPKFVYHDRSRWLLNLKRRAKAVKLYYLLWQKSARDVVALLHQANNYDLMHHVTFAGFRYPVAIWGHGAPCVWGPIGGIEAIPRALLPWRHPRSLLVEMSRNANNLWQTTPFHVLPKRAEISTLILVSTPEMQRTFAKLGFSAEITPTIGLRPASLPFRPREPQPGPLKLLFVGNIITLKGIDLALDALHASGSNATLVMVGDGNFLVAAKKQTARLGLSDRVTFLGRLPREEVLKRYRDYDAFLFPSLHDTGGYAVIEAMFNELPVICLNCGGPAVAVEVDCGQKIPLVSRAKVVADLAAAIRTYDQNRDLAVQHGKTARARVLRDYDWERKAEAMDARYHRVVEAAEAGQRQVIARDESLGMGSMTNIVHGMFSMTGLVVGMIFLLLIGGVGFLSVNHLKKQAEKIVRDTLPGLSAAGEANAGGSTSFNRTMMFLLSDDTGERARLRKEVTQYSKATTCFLEVYQSETLAEPERKLLDKALRGRAEYLRIREKVFLLDDQNKRHEAILACNAELMPSYLEYKDALYQLFEYNVREGRARGETIMRVCTITQWTVAIFGILLFALGFLFGLFK